MKRLESIQTPTGAIKLFQDTDDSLWIQQNNLTKAMGYNKFLSLKCSRLGKYITNFDARKKFGAINVLDLKKVVELLPRYLDGFFREVYESQSRQQFFGNKPAEIIKRTKAILPVLEETIMSYDANSIEAKKGALGEKIVKEWFERNAFVCTRPRDTFASGASIVDFFISHQGENYYAEVKTQIARPYGVENAPCYAIPKSRCAAYSDYEEKHKEPVKMFFVDPKDGIVYSQELTVLETGLYVDARKFPFDKYVTDLGGDLHYWHQDQFDREFQILDDDLAELRKLFGLEEPESKEESQPAIATDKPKSLVENLAAFVNVGKTDLIQAVLELRQKKFDREQAQMKELLG